LTSRICQLVWELPAPAPLACGCAGAESDQEGQPADSRSDPGVAGGTGLSDRRAGWPCGSVVDRGTGEPQQAGRLQGHQRGRPALPTLDAWKFACESGRVGDA